jgi:CBS domain-containing protein
VKEVMTMKARDIMHWNPTVVTPDQPVSHAAEHMRYERDACIPVVKDESRRELVGVITARDLATRCLARCHGLTCTVGEHMTPLPLHTVQLDDDIGTMLQTMHEAEIRRLPVVSADGILFGVVTEAAISEALTLTDWLSHARARTLNGTPRKRSLVN